LRAEYQLVQDTLLADDHAPYALLYDRREDVLYQRDGPREDDVEVVEDQEHPLAPEEAVDFVGELRAEHAPHVVLEVEPEEGQILQVEEVDSVGEAVRLLELGGEHLEQEGLPDTLAAVHVDEAFGFNESGELREVQVPADEEQLLAELEIMGLGGYGEVLEVAGLELCSDLYVRISVAREEQWALADAPLETLQVFDGVVAQLDDRLDHDLLGADEGLVEVHALEEEVDEVQLEDVHGLHLQEVHQVVLPVVEELKDDDVRNLAELLVREVVSVRAVKDDLLLLWVEVAVLKPQRELQQALSLQIHRALRLEHQPPEGILDQPAAFRGENDDLDQPVLLQLVEVELKKVLEGQAHAVLLLVLQKHPVLLETEGEVQEEGALLQHFL